LVKKKKTNKRNKNYKPPVPCPEGIDDISDTDLYGLEDDDLQHIEKAAMQLDNELADKKITHNGVWTKPAFRGGACNKTKVIFKNYGTKII
jgi:hypothetical protein